LGVFKGADFKYDSFKEYKSTLRVLLTPGYIDQGYPRYQKFKMTIFILTKVALGFSRTLISNMAVAKGIDVFLRYF
jgi:putative effector of murein hydrolase